MLKGMKTRWVIMVILCISIVVCIIFSFKSLSTYKEYRDLKNRDEHANEVLEEISKELPTASSLYKIMESLELPIILCNVNDSITTSTTYYSYAGNELEECKDRVIEFVLDCNKDSVNSILSLLDSYSLAYESIIFIEDEGLFVRIYCN